MPAPTFEGLAERYDLSRRIPAAPLRHALGRALEDVSAPGAARVLECGCGTGQILAALPDRAARRVGIDRATSVLRHARMRLDGRASLLSADGCRLPFRTGVFRSAIIAHVLEHVAAWRELIEECFRVTHPDGTLVFVFSPGFVRNLPRSVLKRRLAAKGWPLRRPGVQDRSEIAAYLHQTNRSVVPLTDGAWAWERTVTIGESLGFLERHEYSAFWDVPATLLQESLGEVRAELSDRLTEVERIEARLEVWRAKGRGTAQRGAR